MVLLPTGSKYRTVVFLRNLRILHGCGEVRLSSKSGCILGRFFPFQARLFSADLSKCASNKRLGLCINDFVPNTLLSSTTSTVLASMTMPVANQVETCWGCGAILPTTDLPGHHYMGASSGCWAVYGTVLAREYGEWRLPAVHRLTVDTYSVQHPGTPSRQCIQSVAGHLISLFVVLELGFPPAQATQAIRRAVERSEQFGWLEPPRPRGDLTIVDVANADTLAKHEQVVQR